MYCNVCNDLYSYPINNPYKKLDGANWGTSFAPLFCITYPELIGNRNMKNQSTFVPKIYGFKVYRENNIVNKMKENVKGTRIN